MVLQFHQPGLHRRYAQALEKLPSDGIVKDMRKELFIFSKLAEPVMKLTALSLALFPEQADYNDIFADLDGICGFQNAIAEVRGASAEMRASGSHEAVRSAMVMESRALRSTFKQMSSRAEELLKEIEKARSAEKLSALVGELDFVFQQALAEEELQRIRIIRKYLVRYGLYALLGPQSREVLDLVHFNRLMR